MKSVMKSVRPVKKSYGGQAVIEGVMMRGKETVVTAVRKSNQEIVVRREKIKPWGDRWPILKWPLVRGVTALLESLVLGLEALTFSAAEAGEEADARLSTKDFVVTFGAAFILTVVLFIMIPAYLIRLVSTHIPSNLLLNLVEGLIKVGIFLGYIVAITWLEDIRRVFQYHGAEHKTIHAYEAGEPLEVEKVRKYSTIHPRCGTNFILLVLLVSVFIFSFFGRPPFVQRVLIHIAILPLVAGVSYEILKAAGKERPNLLIQALAAPGMWLQHLTTREPDDAQLEVAIHSLKEVLREEEPENVG